MRTIPLVFLALAVLVLGCIGGGGTQTQETSSNALATVDVTSTTAASANTHPAAESTAQTQTTAAAGKNTQTTSTAAAPSGQFIAKTADVPSGSSVGFTYDGNTALLVNIDGQYLAYLNKCTHKGATTKFDGENIVCPLHGSKFSTKDGSVLNGPASTPLTQINVEVVGDSVYAK
jgi:nitrite reductase/ring-hydroxylating ferredoxin subunit